MCFLSWKSYSFWTEPDLAADCKYEGFRKFNFSFRSNCEIFVLHRLIFLSFEADPKKKTRGIYYKTFPIPIFQQRRKIKLRFIKQKNKTIFLKLRRNFTYWINKFRLYLRKNSYRENSFLLLSINFSFSVKKYP